MPEPDEKIEAGPSGEPVYVRDGEAYFRYPETGKLFKVPVDSPDYALALQNEVPATPDEVRTRLKQYRNADVRELESGMQAFAEGAARSVVDVALTPQRLLGDESTTAAGVLETLGGRPEEEQLQTAEAFGEPTLGASNLGTAAADLALAFVPGGMASRAMKGASLARRMAALGAVDAASGAAGGAAATAEGLWRAGEQMSADKLLAGMGQGALWGAALGGASELLTAGTGALRKRLADLDPVTARSAIDQTAGALDMLGGGRGPAGGIRIRVPHGADTPGSGFGMLPTNRWGNGVAGQAADYVRKVGRRLVGEGKEKLAASEARAAGVLKEADSAIKTRIREAGAAVKKTRSAMAKVEGDLRSATGRLGRVNEAIQRLERDTLRGRARLAAKETALEKRWAGELDGAQAGKQELQRTQARAEAALGKVEARLVEVEQAENLLQAQMGEVPTPRQALRMNKLATRRALLLEDRKALVAQMDGAVSRAKSRVEARSKGAVEALDELTEIRRVGREVEDEGRARLEQIRAHAQEELRLAEQRRASADADYQRALRDEQAAREGSDLIRRRAEAGAEQELAQGKLDAREAFRKSPAFRAADVVLGATAKTRGAALRGAHGAWAINQAAITASDATSEIDRRTDEAVLAATTKNGALTWQNKSGLGDYRNFPDLQLRRPGETRKDAVLRRGDEIARAIANPALMIDRLAQASEGFAMLGPGMTRMMVDKSLKALGYLNQWTWTRAVTNPLQPTWNEAPGLDELALSMFERLWNATMFPGLLIDEVATWSVTEETVSTARMLYPDIHEGLRAQLQEKVFTGEFLPTYDQRIQLSMLLQVPDAQLNPEFLMTYEALIGEAQAEQMAAAQGISSGKPGRPTGSPTLSQQYRTTSQRVQDQ